MENDETNHRHVHTRTKLWNNTYNKHDIAYAHNETTTNREPHHRDRVYESNTFTSLVCRGHECSYSP